jgi:transposase
MGKALSKKELAAMYGVHTVTLIKWLKSINGLELKRNQKILTPLQLNIIFTALGEP